jgi:hypothetical protein
MDFMRLVQVFGVCNESGPEYPSQVSRAIRIDGARCLAEQRLSFLDNLINSCHELEATNQRDRVYAPLALASRFFPSSPQPKHQPTEWIFPDYHHDVDQVFAALSTLLLRNLPLLSFLGTVEDRNSEILLQLPNYTPIPELPSWVPNFSVPRTTNSFLLVCNYPFAWEFWELRSVA